MKEDRSAVDRIWLNSNKKPQRVVVDEILPSGLIRILSAEAKSDRRPMKLTESAAWTEEKEHYVDMDQLRKLMPKNHKGEIVEGEVFFVKSRKSKDVREKTRKGMKSKVGTLLAWEGHRRPGAKEGR